MRARFLFTLIVVSLAALSVAASQAQNDAAAPAPPPQQKTTASPAAPAPPPSVTIIGARDAHGVLGRDVRSPTDEDMGRIVDVIVDRAGSVRAAVVDLAAFLASAVEKSSSTGMHYISGMSPTRGTASRSN